MNPEPPMDLELSEMTESQKVSYILRAAEVDVIRLADVRRRNQQRKAMTAPHPVSPTEDLAG